MTLKSTMPPWVIRPITPEVVYTDRAEPLEYLFEYAVLVLSWAIPIFFIILLLLLLLL